MKEAFVIIFVIASMMGGIIHLLFTQKGEGK